MKKEKICGIYKITSPSGKVYIGESGDIYTKRYLKYRRVAKEISNQPRLYASLLKYGWEMHTFEIIEECEFDELLCRERYWQDFYDVLNQDKGLNCVKTHCDGKKYEWSDESKDKVRGENHYSFGKKGILSPLFGKKRDSSNHVNNKSVINTNTLEEFVSITKAAENAGMDRAKLTEYLLNPYKNPTHYMLKKDYEKLGKIEPCKRKGLEKEVINEDTLKIYKNTSQAAKDLNIDRRALASQLNGEALRKTSLYYYDEWLNGNITTHNKNKQSIEVINVKTDKIYKSIREASFESGLNETTFRKRLKKDKNDTGFMYYKDWLKENN